MGIGFGLIGKNPMPYEPALRLLKDRGVDTLKTWSISPDWLKVVRDVFGSRVKVTVAIPNSEMRACAQDAGYRSWATGVLREYRDIIDYVAVGNEPYASFNRGFSMPYLVDAFLAAARMLEDSGLYPGMKVTIPFSAEVLRDTYPPSNGRFSSGIVSTMDAVLPVLRRQQSSFGITLYPYFAYAGSNDIPLSTALGSGSSGSLFINMVQATRAALKRVGYSDLPLVIQETGWPTSSGKDTNAQNAQVYNAHMRDVALNSGLVDVIILFEAFDELGKGGPAVEEHWGLYTRLGSPKYQFDIRGSAFGDSPVEPVDPVEPVNPVKPSCTQWGWRFYDGYELEGKDLTQVPASSRNACQPACRATSGCSGYTWAPSGTCYLKQGYVSNSDARSKAGYYSATIC